MTGPRNRAYVIGESGKIRWEVLEYLNGRGLDLGCGCDRITKTAIGIDLQQPNPMLRPSQAQLPWDAADLSMFASRSMDFVFSAHLLEHLEHPEKVLLEWWRVVKHDGYMVLYLPIEELYQNFAKDDPTGINQQHKYCPTPADIEKWMKGAGGWDLVRNETHNRLPDEYSFLMVFKKRRHHGQTRSYLEPKPEKTVGVSRYGGYGDHIMAGAIYPVLKAQGWHITVVTNPMGREALEGNPYVDAIITDTAALSDDELRQYWHHLETHRFRRWINMMDSVENVTLPQPTQRTYYLSRTIRENLYNMPYLHTTFAQAEVPMPDPPGAVWHATEAEKQWARGERKKIQGPVVTLAIAGSAKHKVSPWWKQVAAGLIDNGYTVVSVGVERDATHLAFEHPKHLQRAGIWNARQAHAFAGVSDVVLGPETGLLNGVGELDTPAKVLLLSHSSEEQLCGHWKNYVALVQDDEGCPDQPCHRLHWAGPMGEWPFHCQQDEATGYAKCAAAIAPERIVEAVTNLLTQERREVA